MAAEIPTIITDQQSAGITITNEYTGRMMGWRHSVGVKLSGLALVGSLAACGTGNGGNTNNGGGGNGGGDGGSGSSAEVVSSWNTQNCLVESDVDEDIILASRPTDLCRSLYTPVTKNSTFYYLFPRGVSAANYLAIVGSDTSGNYYWEYSQDNLEHEQTASGETGLVKDGTFTSESSDFLTGILARLDAKNLDAILVLQAATYNPSTGTTAATSPNNGQLASQQATEQQQAQQAQEYQTQLANKTAAETTIDQEEAFEVSMNGIHDQVWTDDSCMQGNVGCGGSP